VRKILHSAVHQYTLLCIKNKSIIGVQQNLAQLTEDFTFLKEGADLHWLLKIRLSTVVFYISIIFCIKAINI